MRYEEYLHGDSSDPREPFVRTLLRSLGRTGSICVYTGYEKKILAALTEALPDQRAALLAVIARLWDVYPVIKAHYYHPAFEGSYSLKAVR